MEKIYEKRKNYIVIVLIALFSTTLGLTFAYFGAKVLNSARTDVIVKTDNIVSLIFKNDDKLSFNANLNNFSKDQESLSGTITPSAILTGQGYATASYSVSFEIMNNTFEYTQDSDTPELVLEIMKPDGTLLSNVTGLEYVTIDGVSGFDVTESSGLFSIFDDYDISITDKILNRTQEWLFTINFINLDADQNKNAQKSFESKVIFNENSLGTNDGSMVDYITSLVGTKQGDGVLANEILIGEEFIENGFKDRDFYTNVVNDPNNEFLWDDINKTWTSTNKADDSESLFNFSPQVDGDIFIKYDLSAEEDCEYSSIYLNDEYLDDFNYGEDIYILKDVTTDDVITISYSKDDSYAEGRDNVVFSIIAGEKIIVETDTSYRYQGVNPNNYVMFNNEKWRILGVFDEFVNASDNSESERLVKIVRSESIGELAWDHEDTGDNIEINNNWATSDLYNLLNKEYFLKKDGRNDGLNYDYCWSDENADCNYEKVYGIDEKYRNLVQKVRWNYSSLDYQKSTKYIYKDILEGKSSGDYEPFVDNYVGLLSLSDIYMAVKPSKICTRDIDVKGSIFQDCLGNSWIYGDSMWTITPDFEENRVYHDGGWISYPDYSRNIYPAVYLKSDLVIVAGDGSEMRPYIIE